MITVEELIKRLSELPPGQQVRAECQRSTMWDLAEVQDDPEGGAILVFGECWYP